MISCLASDRFGIVNLRSYSSKSVDFFLCQHNKLSTTDFKRTDISFVDVKLILVATKQFRKIVLKLGQDSVADISKYFFFFFRLTYEFSLPKLH